MVQKMDKKMKNSKIFKIVTVLLTCTLLCIGIITIAIKYIKEEQTQKENIKYENIINNIETLGLEKDGIGFAFLIEEGITYRTYIKKPLSKDYQVTANTTTFTDEEAIYAVYNGTTIKVTYLNENKTTVYCDKNGNLENESGNKNNIEVYNKYKDRTKEIVIRMVELFDSIYNETMN